MREAPTMISEKATLLVRCRFPTGAANRVRVVIDEQTAGCLDRDLRVQPGEHRVRVTSWGLPLCGAIPVNCSPGASVELALRVYFPGFVVGMVIFLAVLFALPPLAFALGANQPGNEPLVILAVAAAAIATCLLVFYVVLPAFSLYTFRLVQTAARPS
jgi:hypothetical protein